MKLLKLIRKLRTNKREEKGEWSNKYLSHTCFSGCKRAIKMSSEVRILASNKTWKKNLGE
jgi:hypothetical protein